MVDNVYFYALSANIFFAASTLIFTEFTNKTSINWVNKYKVLISAIFCFLTIVLFQSWNIVEGISIAFFLMSGFFGLCIGDYFMLNAFQKIGPGRTLVLYGFTPLIVGVGSFFLFNQSVNSEKFIAIIFMMACLFTFSYEKFKQSGSWEISGFLMALIFVVLDSSALLMTRYAFEHSKEISAMEGHFYRCLGALAGFWALMIFKPINFVPIFKRLTNRQKIIITFGSFLGTFLSLACYFKAVQTGHMATITSISITTPFVASIFECVYYKKKPSKYLMIAFVLFACGFYIITK